MLPPPDPTAPRIFIDSSVLMSGILSQRGASYAVLVLAELGLLRLILCPYVQKEVERNLNLKTPEILPLYQQLTARINWEVIPDPSPAAVLPLVAYMPAKDAPVLAAAIQSAPHRLITLDAAHFIRAINVSQLSGVAICTPGDLLRQIRGILTRGFEQE